MPVMQALLEQGSVLVEVVTSASKTGLAGGVASSADANVNSEWDTGLTAEKCGHLANHET